MPKYLIQASYTVSGEEGVRAKGGTDRRNAIADTVKSVGGTFDIVSAPGKGTKIEVFVPL